MQITREIIQQIFREIKKLNIGIIGDFALDFYYQIEQTTGEFSVETKKEVYWGKNPICTLGGAGNLAANFAGLGANNLNCFGLIGNDIFGRELAKNLKQISPNTEGILSTNNYNTSTYIKPYLNSEEINRLDFGTKNTINEADFYIILQKLEAILPSLDLLILNQQFPQPLLSPNRIKKLNQILENHPNCTTLADLRANGLFLTKSILKVNTAELAKLININNLPEHDTENCILATKLLSNKINCNILLTRGPYGSLFYDKNEMYLAEAIKIEGEIDTVGAGDTMVAAFALALKTNKNILNSLEFANLAAAVSIQKLNQTGTASKLEILNLINKI